MMQAQLCLLAAVPVHSLPITESYIMHGPSFQERLLIKIRHTRCQSQGQARLRGVIPWRRALYLLACLLPSVCFFKSRTIPQTLRQMPISTQEQLCSSRHLISDLVPFYNQGHRRSYGTAGTCSELKQSPWSHCGSHGEFLYRKPLT
jgi:hypothetical protein